MLAETTIQADVGPGDQTGIYYITICNLPFGTSWQQLKDWARSACDVDHIEVFQNSTSGWVRVKGKDNFERAWGLLNGGVFNGRSIIASDRNRGHPIKIKELVDSSQVYSQTPCYQLTPSTQLGSPPSPIVSPQYSAVSAGQYYVAGYPQASGASYSGHTIPAHSYGYQPAMTTAMTIPATYGAADTGKYCYDGNTGGLEQGAVMYSPQYQYENASFGLPHRGRSDLSSHYEGYEAPSAEPVYNYASDYILTEQRKLHVSPFPQQARAEDVRSWIHRRVDKSTIETIDIPQNSNSRYLRGHVFVIFDSASAANTAMDQLNKARFQGRRVIARPTVEGVTADEPSLPYESSSPSGAIAGSVYPGSRSSHDDRSRGDKSERSRHHHKESSSSSVPETDKKRASSEKKLGTSTSSSSSSNRKGSHSHSSHSHSHSHSERKSSSSSSSSKRTSSNKTSSKDTGPVIVDGTSRKRDKR